MCADHILKPHQKKKKKEIISVAQYFSYNKNTVWHHKVQVLQLGIDCNEQKSCSNSRVLAAIIVVFTVSIQRKQRLLFKSSFTVISAPNQKLANSLFHLFVVLLKQTLSS